MAPITRERFNPPSLPEAYPLFRPKLIDELRRISRVIAIDSQDLGSVATSATVPIRHMTTLTLTGNAALTLSIEGLIPGDSGFLELLQDATGGRVPTWVNATGTASAVTAPTATANKRTMYHCVWNGDKWVLDVHASNYSY